MRAAETYLYPRTTTTRFCCVKLNWLVTKSKSEHSQTLGEDAGSFSSEPSEPSLSLPFTLKKAINYVDSANPYHLTKHQQLRTDVYEPGAD
jgi:hypothetical protein